MCIDYANKKYIDREIKRKISNQHAKCATVLLSEICFWFISRVFGIWCNISRTVHAEKPINLPKNSCTVCNVFAHEWLSMLLLAIKHWYINSKLVHLFVMRWNMVEAHQTQSQFIPVDITQHAHTFTNVATKRYQQHQTRTNTAETAKEVWICEKRSICFTIWFN